jgi:hypothetical protein
MKYWPSALSFLATFVSGVFSIATPCHGEVLGYTARRVGSDTALTCLVVDRGAGPVAYDAERLIGARLTHFCSPHTRNVVYTMGAEAPDGSARSRLLGDLKLNTGIINPGGAAKPLTTDPVVRGGETSPGLAVRFDPPVVNRPGDDVVVFEVQRDDSPAEGDAFHVGPLHFTPGLKAIVVDRFDVTCDDPTALIVERYRPYLFRQPTRSLEDFEQRALEPADSPGGFKALAVGIDLSDLGYSPGAEVDGLFFQDAGLRGPVVDPVLIAGLPAPEPPNVLAEVPPLPTRVKGLLEACLEGPTVDFDEIVFAERVPGNDHWYANFGATGAETRSIPSSSFPMVGTPSRSSSQGAEGFAGSISAAASSRCCWMIQRAGYAIRRFTTTARRYSSLIARVASRTIIFMRSALTERDCNA